MSKVTDIYTQLVTLVTAALPSHAQLANPYNVEANDEMRLALGFGVVIGECANTNRQISSSSTIARAYRIVLTLVDSAPETDGDARADVENTLMESGILIIKALERDPALSETAMNVKWLGDTGIEFVASTTDGAPGFYKTEITLQIEYRESLS